MSLRKTTSFWTVPQSPGEAIEKVWAVLWIFIGRSWLMVIALATWAITGLTWWLGLWGSGQTESATFGWLLTLWPLPIIVGWRWRRRIGHGLSTATRWLITNAIAYWQISLVSITWIMGLFAWWIGIGPEWLFWPLLAWPFILAIGLSRKPIGLRWSAARSYWITAGLLIVLVGWRFLPKGPVVSIGAVSFTIWAAIFVYRSLKRQPHGGAKIPTGHIISKGNEDSPHWTGFLPILFRWGIFPPLSEGDIRIKVLVQGLRLLLGLGPIFTGFLTTAGLFLGWRFNSWWWTTCLALGSYWIVFAAFGWWRIRYIVTTTKDGKPGRAIVSLPQFTLLGIKTNTLTCSSDRLRTTVTKTHWSGAETVDPGTIIGEEPVIFPWAQHAEALLGAIG